MQKAFLLLLLVGFSFSPLAAQPAEDSYSHHPAAQQAFDSILIELQSIRKLQVEAKEERNRIWNSHQQAQAGHPDSVEKLSNEYGAILSIAENTHKNDLTDDWNLFGWITFFIALASLIVGYVTYSAQKSTEEHTSKAPKELQLYKLLDLPRHFYRNLVCTCSLIFLFKAEGPEKKRKRYPSESNLRKLMTLPDDIVLPIDVDSNKDAKNNSFSLMHELKLLLRNYNIEVEVASEHLARPTITDDALKEDFDNLLFKPFSLVRSTFSYENSIKPLTDKEFVNRTMLIILAEHFKKLEEASNFNNLFKEKAQACLKDAFKPVHGNRLQFLATVDKKGGVDRSLGKLLKVNEDIEKEKLLPPQMLQRKEALQQLLQKLNTKEKSYSDFFFGKEQNDHPDRQATKATSDNKENRKNHPDNKSMIPGIADVTSFDIFSLFYQRHWQKDENNREVKESDLRILYKLLAPYFNYLHHEEWDFTILLQHILIVDAAIETDRIGMINYQ